MSGDEVNQKRRRLLTATVAVGSVGAVAGAVPFMSSWQPSAKARAIGAPIEVDVSDMKVGQLKKFEWQGKPVWVLRRSEAMINDLVSVEAELSDPESSVDQQPAYAQNAHRSRKPEFLVVVGVCTHLGCSPSFQSPESLDNASDAWKGGFYCPCHGSRFDMAGRVYRNVPAPTNLIVPPYKFVSDTRILIGDDSEETA